DLPAAPRIGRAAASLLMQKLDPNDLLAIGWGEATTTTLRYMAPVFPQSNISIVSLTGGVSAYIGTTGLYGPQNNAHLIPTPLRVSSEDLAEMLRVEPYVRNVLDMAATARFGLIGVGAVTSAATLVRYGYCSAAEIELFKRRGAVGDVLGYFYDADGEILDLDLHRHVVAVRPDDLRKIPNVAAAAAGPHKIDAILGMLRGKLANILVTDEDTATELLRRHG
ncbi:MAG: sugar-binding transcriptional regulator, partial [Maritimibacter sp.]|nr:sugar-binding transcriptional regulator [Maritimibacter sp.]